MQTQLPPPPVREFSPSSRPTQRRTLLIVDDEEGPRQSLRVVFKEDYNLLMANDGNRAIELAKQNKVDVAITDIRMVGMSGVELLEHLKLVDPGIEVIMLTAYETLDTLRLALRLGACDYLNKPFDVATMRKTVATAVERRSLGEEIRNNCLQLQALQKELEDHKDREEISRTRGEIYASIIHDINGPLTVISGFVQLMSQRVTGASRLEGEDLDFVKDRLKTMTRQVTNCIEISRRYLSFLRQDADQTSAIGVNVILEDLRELMRVHPSLHDNEFSIEPLEDEVMVHVNATDLIQILLNLVVNGLQCSTANHSVKVLAQLQTGSSPMDTFVDGPNELIIGRDGFKQTNHVVVISVIDTGPGIPADILPHIFDPYFTTKPATQGTGLGLNVVQRLIREIKAVMHVATVAGKGTCFTIYLPVV